MQFIQHDCLKGAQTIQQTFCRSTLEPAPLPLPFNKDHVPIDLSKDDTRCLSPLTTLSSLRHVTDGPEHGSDEGFRRKPAIPNRPRAHAHDRDRQDYLQQRLRSFKEAEPPVGWEFTTDRPGKPPGWITRAANGSAVLSFRVLMARGLVTLSYLRSYEDAGRVKARGQGQNEFPHESSIQIFFRSKGWQQT